MATNIFDMTDTWNNGGTVFNAIKMAVTQTASAAGSKIMNLLRNGVSQFAVDPVNGVTVGVPTGDALGPGKVNVSGGYYINGTPLLGQVTGTGNFPVFNDTVLGLIVRPIVSTDLPSSMFTAIGGVKAKAKILGEVFVGLDESGAFESATFSAAAVGQIRERVTGAKAYFVNASTGNDTFDGLSATVGTFPVGPVATIQKAVDLIASNLDLLPGATPTITVADGAYTGPVVLRSLVGSVLSCTITGNAGTPANVTVTSNNAACFSANRSNASWTLNGFKVIGTGNTASIGVNAANGSVITIQNFEFGACTGGHLQSTSTSNLTVASNYKLSGGGPFHFNCTTNAMLVPGGRTLTIDPASSATVTISNATPAVVTWNAHGLGVNTVVTFATTGALPNPLVVGTQYHVIAAGLGANVFEIAATPGGAAINTTTAGSGIHTATAGPMFSTAFAQGERSSLLLANAMTFAGTGNVGGVRHIGLTVGLLDTQSGSATYFPGSIAGNLTPVATPFGAVMS